MAEKIQEWKADLRDCFKKTVVAMKQNPKISHHENWQWCLIKTSQSKSDCPNSGPEKKKKCCSSSIPVSKTRTCFLLRKDPLPMTWHYIYYGFHWGSLTPIELWQPLAHFVMVTMSLFSAGFLSTKKRHGTFLKGTGPGCRDRCTWTVQRPRRFGHSGSLAFFVLCLRVCVRVFFCGGGKIKDDNGQKTRKTTI